MAALTNAECAAILDLRFPTSGATDYVAYSVNGTSEWANLARTFVGATGWAAATIADPSVKANAVLLLSATVVTAGSTVTHFSIYSASSGGTQRTDWISFFIPQIVIVGDRIQWDIGTLQVTLT